MEEQVKKDRIHKNVKDVGLTTLCVATGKTFKEFYDEKSDSYENYQISKSVEVSSLSLTNSNFSKDLETPEVKNVLTHMLNTPILMNFKRIDRIIAPLQFSLEDDSMFASGSFNLEKKKNRTQEFNLYQQE